MSAKLFKEDILFLQRILAVSGYYKGPLNGKWSDDVDAAEEAFLARSEEIKGEFGEFDQRTETCIKTLIPDAQTKAREFMNALKGRTASSPARVRTRSKTRFSTRGRESPKLGEVSAITISGSHGT